jgi:hypothetical protein
MINVKTRKLKLKFPQMYNKKKEEENQNDNKLVNNIISN